MDAMERLKVAMDSAGSCACIGIDPVVERMANELKEVEPALAMAMFCKVVLDHVHETVGVVKFQSACFERYGHVGYAILEQSIALAKGYGLCVILDAKRGDIGASAAHYAAGALAMGADLITCSPYMGRSSIEPFLDAGLGVFALCRTSNQDGDELQALVVDGEGTVALKTAEMIVGLGDQVGAVVGATNGAEETKALRAVMPDGMFLVPGVGAQGGSMDDVKAMCRSGAGGHGDLGVVVNASRSVLYAEAEDGEAWYEAVRREAGVFARVCGELLGG